MSDLSTSKRALVIGLLGAAAVGTVVHLAWAAIDRGADLDPFFNDWLYNGVLVAAAAACIARGVFVRPERAGWLALAAGITAWTAADIYWTLEFSGQKDIPYPSFADALYLAFYPLCFVAIILIVRRRAARFHASQWLDGVIGALATAAIGAALVAPALLDLGAKDTAALVTNLAYPLGDLLLMAFVIGALVLTMVQRTPVPGREWALLALGLLVTAIADVLFLQLEATGSYAEGTPLDSMWLFGILLIALAAWVQTRPAPIELGGRGSVLFPCLFAICAIGVLVAEVVADQVGPPQDLPTLAVALAIVTLALVVLRLFMALGENTRLLDVVRRESVTDALTGLGNRRLLLKDLERVLSPDGGRPETTFALYDLDGFKAYNDSFGHPAGDLLLKRLGRSLADSVRPSGTAYRLGGDEFCVIASGNGMKPESLLAAASAALREEGEGFTIHSSRGSVALPYEADDRAAAMRLADRRMYAEKGRRSGSAERQAHDVLLRLLREREPELGEHLRGVAQLAVRLGRALEMGSEELDVLTRAAELHDIGKMAIPDAILHKPGPLTPAEWDMVRGHTVVGERILDAAAALTPVAKVVRSTHERWDGGGYPDGLAGEEIPLAARVVFVCDAYDAMTAERIYRPTLSPDEAIEELRSNAGTQFDPALVELFCERVAPRPAGRIAVGGAGHSL